MPKTLGPYHMANNADYEAQRTNNFEVQKEMKEYWNMEDDRR